MRHPEACVGKYLHQRIDEERVSRILQPPARGRAMPLQQLQHPFDIAIGGHEIRLVIEPFDITRDMCEGLEDLRLEVMAHEGLAFGRSGRRCRQHGLHAREECLAPGQRLLGHGDARVIVLRLCLRGRAGSDRFPGTDEAGRRVLSQQVAERRRSGARQPQADEGCLDLLLVDLRVLGIAVLDLQPARQEIDDLTVERRAAALSEPCLGVGRGDEDSSNPSRKLSSPKSSSEVAVRACAHQLGGSAREAMLRFHVERLWTGRGRLPAVIR